MSSPPHAEPPSRRTKWGRWGLFQAVFADSSPLDLRLIGRTLLHVIVVGAVAGLAAVLFFGGLELVEEVFLTKLAGYARLRAEGEGGEVLAQGRHVRLWLLAILPAIGALGAGIVASKLAPETMGGGGDAMINAFHRQGGFFRKRVAAVKLVASILTLGFGGAGGREGPTMQIGAALGSIVARGLRVSRREQRILMIAGVAAGISAIFRTPLGAALLATEVLYRDDFESDALIPALLASVVSYSVFISFYGESTLFAHSAHYPFIPAHLPLYGLLAVMLAPLALAFLGSMSLVKKVSGKIPGPMWLKPAIGGLGLGLFTAPIIWFVGRRLAEPGHGVGLLGGGYGAVQVAITGADWLPQGWGGVRILLLLCVAKLVASSLTIGSGGSAGDFAPSLVLGGLFGGAFGRAAQLVFHDPRIDPGAFALVGMGTFYGGIAHVPVSSLVMVCELCGSYDLLVPLMLAEGIAFVVLRKRSLYHAQLPTQRDSPAHPHRLLDVLKTVPVSSVLAPGQTVVTFTPATPASEMLRRVAEAASQDVFPVLDEAGTIVGMITAEALRIVASERELEAMTVAADAMQPPVTLHLDDDLRAAVEALVRHSLREIPVLDAAGRIAGLLDEGDVGKSYLAETSRPESPDATPMVRV